MIGSTSKTRNASERKHTSKHKTAGSNHQHRRSLRIVVFVAVTGVLGLATSTRNCNTAATANADANGRNGALRSTIPTTTTTTALSSFFAPVDGFLLRGQTITTKDRCPGRTVSLLLAKASDARDSSSSNSSLAEVLESITHFCSLPSLPATTTTTTTPGRFDVPFRGNDAAKAYVYTKRHSLTVCLVPPSSQSAWVVVREVRLALRDPGFFRWPPHVNLLYPFVEGAVVDEGEIMATTPRPCAILANLRRAARSVEPFWVSLDLHNLKTFGDDTRGVLWADPRSYRSDGNRSQPGASGLSPPLSPIEELQSLLEHEFPMCSESLKERSFVPHMTVSANFDSVADAKAAAANLTGATYNRNNTIDANANNRNNNSISVVSFWCNELYLLERNGDRGQFQRKATIKLGRGSDASDNNTNSLTTGIRLHDPPQPIEGMPLVEEEWVRSEHELLRAKRKKNQKNRRRGGGGTRLGYRARKRMKQALAADGEDEKGRRRLLRHDTPEDIAKKRAERKARREQ